MPRRRKRPDADIVSRARQLWTDFNDSLEERGIEGVTEKEKLREMYRVFKAECVPPAQGKGFNFGKVIFILKEANEIRLHKGKILPQDFETVSVDQHLTQRKATEGPQTATPTKGKKGKAGASKGGCTICDVCGVTLTSEKSRIDHNNGKRHRKNMTKNQFNTTRSLLVANKNKLSITPGCENGLVEMTVKKGECNQIVFTITNDGQDPSILVSVKLLIKPRKELTIMDEYGVFARGTEVKIPTGCIYTVKLNCSGAANLGRLKNHIVFAFRSGNDDQVFHILRSVSITVTSDIMDDLLPSKPYTRPPRFAARRKRGAIVPGIPTSGSRKNPLKGIPLKPFDVPKKKAVNNKDRYRQFGEELQEPLTAHNHREKFHNLLYVEELQMRVDIRQYDRKDQVLSKDKNPSLLRLHVPGLAENRPSVLKGDHLFATFSDQSDPKTYQGIVHRVEQEDVLLGFNSEFLKKKVDIEFTFNRLPVRLAHHAVDTATSGGNLTDLLFPGDNLGSRAPLRVLPVLEKFKTMLFDQKLGTNLEQVQAVHHIVSGTSRPAPYLVFGPPGTGKTVTIVEAAKQVFQLLPRSRILLCAPSNSAADLLAVRLLSNGTPIDPVNMMRFYASSRPLNTLDKFLLNKKCCNQMDGDLYIPTKEEIAGKRVMVTTLVTAGRLALADFHPDFFTHVMIDEAGHATEPDALIALSGILNLQNPDGGQVVLAGDPQQLGPVLRSPLAIQHGLAISFLERLMTSTPAYARRTDAAHECAPYDKRILTKLLQNYRSHPSILRLPNEMFYDNELKVFADQMVRESFCNWDELPKKNFPVIFHGVDGKDEREEQSPSFFNRSEVEVAVDYVRKVMDKRGGQKIKQEDIGVISPYRKQVEKLRGVLKKRRYDNIKVGSVEEFQGQERLVIIISTVRSTKAEYIQMDVDFKLGFLKNPKRFNVAVTRAKALLIIVGNPFMLSKDEHWNGMLEFIWEHGGYVGCDYQPDNENEDEDDFIDQFASLNLETGETAAGDEEGLDISHVAQQNGPAFRGEV